MLGVWYQQLSKNYNCYMVIVIKLMLWNPGKFITKTPIKTDVDDQFDVKSIVSFECYV